MFKKYRQVQHFTRDLNLNVENGKCSVELNLSFYILTCIPLTASKKVAIENCKKEIFAFSFPFCILCWHLSVFLKFQRFGRSSKIRVIFPIFCAFIKPWTFLLTFRFKYFLRLMSQKTMVNFSIEFQILVIFCCNIFPIEIFWWHQKIQWKPKIPISILFN